MSRHETHSKAAERILAVVRGGYGGIGAAYQTTYHQRVEFLSGPTGLWNAMKGFRPDTVLLEASVIIFDESLQAVCHVLGANFTVKPRVSREPYMEEARQLLVKQRGEDGRILDEELRALAHLLSYVRRRQDREVAAALR